jgi:hypothetical protein
MQRCTGPLPILEPERDPFSPGPLYSSYKTYAATAEDFFLRHVPCEQNGLFPDLCSTSSVKIEANSTTDQAVSCQDASSQEEGSYAGSHGSHHVRGGESTSVAGVTSPAGLGSGMGNVIGVQEHAASRDGGQAAASLLPTRQPDQLLVNSANREMLFSSPLDASQCCWGVLVLSTPEELELAKPPSTPFTGMNTSESTLCLKGSRPKPGNPGRYCYGVDGWNLDVIIETPESWARKEQEREERRRDRGSRGRGH